MSQGRLAIALAPCARGRRRGIVCAPAGDVCQQCGGEIGDSSVKITGSKLPLVIACPAAAALPQIDPPPSPPAIRGTDCHRFTELVAVERARGLDLPEARAAALAQVPDEHRPYLEGIDLAALPTHLLPEAAFALDWRNRSARFLGTGLGRQYPEPESDTEIMLTIDLFGVAPEAVLVEDYKFGRTRYGAPERFAQTLAAALAASYVHKVDVAHVGLIYVDRFGEAYPVRGQVDGWDLETFAGELEAAMDRVGEARAQLRDRGALDVQPGEHCAYCPAYKACPDKVSLIRAMSDPLVEVGGVPVLQSDRDDRLDVQREGYLAPSRLADTWKKIGIIREIVNRIEEEIRACSMREPIDLGDGWFLGPKEINREAFDAKIAREVVAGFLGEERAAACVTMEIAKSAIEREATAHRNNAIGKGETRIVLSSKKGDGLLDRIYAEIRRRGGSSTSTTNNPTVHRRKA